MDLQLFQDHNPIEIAEMLDAQADEVTEETYLQPYDTEKMMEKRKQYVDLSIEFKKITDEENEIKEEFKERKAPLKKSLDAVLANIKQGGEYVKGKLYKICDQDERVVGFYNEKGELVKQRKALPKELNSPTIFANIREAEMKTGTKDN